MAAQYSFGQLLLNNMSAHTDSLVDNRKINGKRRRGQTVDTQ